MRRADTASYYEENCWEYRWIRHASVVLQVLIAIVCCYLVFSWLR